MLKYYIITYGCQLNEHESEKLSGMLSSLGYSPSQNKEEADIIVFNTCTIREGAENKAMGNIGALKQMKKKKPNLIIAVCGCMTQQPNKAEYLIKKFPFISIVFGTHNLHKFKDYLLEYEKTHKKVVQVWAKETLENVETEIVANSTTNANVNIMYGCNNFCSYCIVPYVRGRERSRPFNDIINEVKALISKEFKTITLLGQNVNSYGKDFQDKNHSFPNLLNELCKLEGDFEIKFLTSHPKDLSDELIDVIAKNLKISRQIHLPVQSASNTILKAMNRNYTIEHYMDIVKKIKSKIPDVALSTDIIVGFPGETEEDFMKTYQLVKEVEYGTFFGFLYSKRKGTPAAQMENQIDLSIKKRRLNELFALQKQIANKRKETNK